MLTYELKKAPGLPLYEALYRCIRSDILTGKLPAGYRLPSKRALAQHLEVSKSTVEKAYDHLCDEGYIQPVEKVGYFVEEGQARSYSGIRPGGKIFAPAGSDCQHSCPFPLLRVEQIAAAGFGRLWTPTAAAFAQHRL